MQCQAIRPEYQNLVQCQAIRQTVDTSATPAAPTRHQHGIATDTSTASDNRRADHSTPATASATRTRPLDTRATPAAGSRCGAAAGSSPIAAAIAAARSAPDSTANGIGPPGAMPQGGSPAPPRYAAVRFGTGFKADVLRFCRASIERRAVRHPVWPALLFLAFVVTVLVVFGVVC
jgi:hypothetical protein